MFENHSMCVEVITAIAGQGYSGIRFNLGGHSPWRVYRIAYKGITCRREVDTNLMWATRDNIDVQKCPVLLEVSLDDPTF